MKTHLPAKRDYSYGLEDYSYGLEDYSYGLEDYSYDSEDSNDFGYRELMENKQGTEHRQYSKITHNGRHTMNFSLEVANYILKQGLVNDKTNPKNVVCSPLSIDAVLNVLALGAKGPTLKQLLVLLGCNGVDHFNATSSLLASIAKESKESDSLEISLVNALWVDKRYSLNTSFETVLRDLYKAQVKAVDFDDLVDEAVKELNSWAKKESKGFIKEILSKDALSKDTAMLLVNALYFKGTWVEKFKPEYTKNGDFFLLNGSKVEVPFMNITNMGYDYGTIEGCQVLRMLYEEEERYSSTLTRSFSIYIFLPNTKDGLPDLLDKIQINSSMFKDKLELKDEIIDNLSIPKFSFECELPLSEPMKQLGLALPFDKDCKDLTGIVVSPANGTFYVSDVVQKCRVETDEVGTKAATFSTVVGLCSPGYSPVTPPPPINFVADHPFLFMIREDIEGALLFVGTLLNPLQP